MRAFPVIISPQVASQAGQFIAYKCRKGQCGTCQVRVDGQWIKTCQTRVPPAVTSTETGELEPFKVEVRGSGGAVKASSRFFSFRWAPCSSRAPEHCPPLAPPQRLLHQPLAA